MSPDGTRLELVEHDGEYIIKADDLPLMLTRVHFSKVELARVVCEKLQPGARVMIGGLGLGYTLRTVLDLLLARGFDIDGTLCPNCGGSMRLIAALTDESSIRHYLTGVGLPAAPPRAPAAVYWVPLWC